jgi:hypothetical protein
MSVAFPRWIASSTNFADIRKGTAAYRTFLATLQNQANPAGAATPSPDDAKRLTALRAGAPVSGATEKLPEWARVGETTHWWRLATVRPDETVTFRDDNGLNWLAENGL